MTLASPTLREVVAADGRRWRFLPDPAPPLAGRLQAIASAQLIDELTGLPPDGVPAPTTRSPGATPRAAEGGGLVGLVGRPIALFPVPWPGVDPRLHLRIEGDPRFLPLDLEGPVPATPGWPDAFERLDFGTVALHRAPTPISGRVVSRATGAPVVGATVAVVEAWERLGDIAAGPGFAPLGLALSAGLYADRSAATATVARRNLTLAAPAKRLLRAAGPGATALRIEDRQGVVVGRALALSAEDPERAEYVPVAAVDAGIAADQPAEVALAQPLRRAHPAGASVATTTPAATGAANPLLRDARAGDASLLAAALAGFGPASRHLVIAGGGPAPEEVHAVAPWRATTGADGTYRLPAIHRLAHLRLRASGGGQPGTAEAVLTLATPTEAFVELIVP